MQTNPQPAPAPQLNPSPDSTSVLSCTEGTFPAEFSTSSLDGVNGFNITSTSSNFGVSVAGVGDINGDGKSDFIIGTYDEVTFSNANAAYIVFGANSFPATFTTATLDGTNGFKISASSVSMFGRSVADAGDINGDGKHDLIIGTFHSDTAYVIFGASSFPSVFLVSELNGVNGFRIIGPSSVSFGFAVAGAGDVNGDGKADLIIGTYGAPKVYVVFGASSFPNALTAESYLNGANGFVLTSTSTSFGYSVAGAGDINGDGKADMIIGTYDNTNTAYVIFGAVSFPATFSTSVLNGENGFELTSTIPNFGHQVAGAGDINGDGKSDLVVATYNNTNTAYVIFGASNFSATFSTSSLHGTNGFAITSSRLGFGQSVAGVGDINCDGRSDLAIGAPGAQAAYVIFGANSFSAASFSIESYLNSTNGFTFTSTSINFGFSVAGVGNVNGNGKSGLIVGAHSAKTAYITLGQDRSLPPVLSPIPANCAADFPAVLNVDSLALGKGFTLTSQSATFGSDVAGIGDVNGDGKNDFILGATGANKAYVIFGGKNFPQTFDMSSFTSSDGFTLTSSTSFGWMVDGIKDVNGDGKNDFIVGTYDANKAYVIFGATSFPDVLDVSNLNGSNGFVLTSSSSKFGYAVSGIGDVNGDEKSDFVVTAYLSNRAYIIFGASNFPATLDTSMITGSTGFTITTATMGFGTAVAGVGDVNGDRKSDFIVTSYTSQRAYVIFGSRSFPSTVDLSTLLMTTGGVTIMSSSSGFGQGVAGVNDINGDKKPDFIIGAYSAKNAYVIFGADTFPSTLDTSNLGGRGFIITSPSTSFGQRVAGIGDINGDGKNDFAIGACGDDGCAKSVYVIFGASSFPTSLNTNSLASSNGFTVTSSSSNFGIAIDGLDDVNGDGKPDFIIGTSDSRKAYVIFGEGCVVPQSVPVDTSPSHGPDLGLVPQFTPSPGSTSAPQLNSDIKVVVLEGTHFEMGVQYGKAMQQELQGSLDLLKSFFLNQCQIPYDTLVKRAQEFYDRYSFSYKLILRGISESTGLTLEDINILNGMETLSSLAGDRGICTATFNSTLGGCAFVYLPPNKATSGSSFLGRNYDFPFPYNLIAKNLTVTILKEPNSITTAIISLPGQIYCPTCINAKGYFLELNNGGPSGGTQKALERQSMLVNMLYVSQNSENFLEMSKQLQATQSDYSLIVNAASNDTVQSYEYSSFLGMKPYMPNDKASFVSTNFFQNITWGDQIPTPEDSKTWYGVTRKNNLDSLASSQDLFSVPDFQDLMMKKISSGGAVWSYGDGTTWVGTIYQIIFDSSAKRLYLTRNLFDSGKWHEIDLSYHFNLAPISPIAAPMPSIPIGAPSEPKQPPFTKSSNIGVIGAGPAGVHMAYTLKKLGYKNITILEANDRVGGKSYSYRSANGDVYIEKGTTWAVIGYPILKRFFDELGISCDNTQLSLGFITDEGLRTNAQYGYQSYLKRINKTPLEYSGQQFYEDVEEAKTKYYKLRASYMDPKYYPLPAKEHSQMLAEPFSQFLDRNDLSILNDVSYTLFVSNAYSGSRDMSTYYGFMWITPEVLATFPSAPCYVRGGYQTVWEAAVQKQNIKVVKNCIVDKVWYTDNSTVRVYSDTCNGKSDSIFEFDFLITSAAYPLQYLVNPTSLHLDVLHRNTFSYGIISNIVNSRSVNGFNKEQGLTAVANAGEFDNPTHRFSLYAVEFIENKFPKVFANQTTTPKSTFQYLLDLKPYGYMQPNTTRIKSDLKDQLELYYNQADVEFTDNMTFWSNYFPHFLSEDIERGYPWRLLEDVQSLNNTWFIGGSSAFELVPSVMLYNELLLKGYGILSYSIGTAVKARACYCYCTKMTCKPSFTGGDCVEYSVSVGSASSLTECAHACVSAGGKLSSCNLQMMSILVTTGAIFEGTKNNDQFDIDTNSDATILGSYGADIFVIHSNPGVNITIIDFNKTDEIIDLSNFTQIKTFADLNVTKDKGVEVINLPGNERIILQNLDSSDLDASNFVFANEVFPVVDTPLEESTNNLPWILGASLGGAAIAGLAAGLAIYAKVKGLGCFGSTRGGMLDAALMGDEMAATPHHP